MRQDESAGGPRPVLPLVAVFSRYPALIEAVCGEAVERFGPLAIASEPFAFTFSDYYQRQMGTDLVKQFWVFDRLREPELLAEDKRWAIAVERRIADRRQHPEPRPINLDPGYLTEAKLVLATTKDRDHRIYLRDGIYAEVTLHYYHGQWTGRPWTYADYAAPDSLRYFSRCRELLRRRLKDLASRSIVDD